MAHISHSPYITTDSATGVDFNILVKLHTRATPKNLNYSLKPNNHHSDTGVRVTDKMEQLAHLGVAENPALHRKRIFGTSPSKKIPYVPYRIKVWPLTNCSHNQLKLWVYRNSPLTSIYNKKNIITACKQNFSNQPLFDFILYLCIFARL